MSVESCKTARSWSLHFEGERRFIGVEGVRQDAPGTLVPQRRVVALFVLALGRGDGFCRDVRAVFVSFFACARAATVLLGSHGALLWLRGAARA